MGEGLQTIPSYALFWKGDQFGFLSLQKGLNKMCAFIGLPQSLRHQTHTYIHTHQRDTHTQDYNGDKTGAGEDREMEGYLTLKLSIELAQFLRGSCHKDLMPRCPNIMKRCLWNIKRPCTLLAQLSRPHTS